MAVFIHPNIRRSQNQRANLFKYFQFSILFVFFSITQKMPFANTDLSRSCSFVGECVDRANWPVCRGSSSSKASDGWLARSLFHHIFSCICLFFPAMRSVRMKNSGWNLAIPLSRNSPMFGCQMTMVTEKVKCCSWRDICGVRTKWNNSCIFLVFSIQILIEIFSQKIFRLKLSIPSAL